MFFYSPKRKYLHLLSTTEDTENTERLCPYFLYSVFSVPSVVKPVIEIGVKILALDYN